MIHLAAILAAGLLANQFPSAHALSTPTLLTQFTSDVRIENLTILPNSTLVVCNAYKGDLHGINPLDLDGASGAEPYFITSFAPRSSAIFGLAATQPYTIAATACNFTWGNPPSVEPGTNIVYTVSLNESEPQTKAFPIPSAYWLNGLTAVPGAPHYLLVADCIAGALLRLDTRTGDVQTVSSDPLFITDLSSSLPIGINGVRAVEGWVYFTNTYLGLYGRLAITADGLAVGTPAEVVAYGIDGATFDDFALTPEGVGYLASGLTAASGIERITPAGKGRMVAEWETGSPNISQPVSAVFGQTETDKSVLYFATAGEYYSDGDSSTSASASGAQVFSLVPKC